RRGSTPRRAGAISAAEQRFGFVQWDFAGALGPPPGRYVVRRFAGDEAREVIVVTQTGAPAPAGRLAGRLGRRPRRVAPPASVDAVPVTRVTVVGAKPLSD